MFQKFIVANIFGLFNLQEESQYNHIVSQNFQIYLLEENSSQPEGDGILSNYCMTASNLRIIQNLQGEQVSN